MKIREVLNNPPDRLFRSSTILVLGKPKSGKTRFASTVGRTSFQQPCTLLHIDQDNGGGGQRFTNPALIPEKFNEYKEILELVEKAVRYQDGPPYKAAFLGRTWTFNGILVDTLNRLQDMLRREIKGGYLSEKRLKIQDFGTMLDDLLGLILALKELSESKPFHIVLTAQISPDRVALREKQKDTEDAAAAYYWMPSLQGSIGPKLAEHVDMAVTVFKDPTQPPPKGFKVFGSDVITDTGTYSGGLRYLDYFLAGGGRTENMPHTWWEILKAHGVDVDHPETIGLLDATVHVEQHWSSSNKNRTSLEKLLTDKGIPIETLFRACNVEDWGDMTNYPGTGSQAFSLAITLHDQNGNNKPTGDLWPADLLEPESQQEPAFP